MVDDAPRYPSYEPDTEHYDERDRPVFRSHRTSSDPRRSDPYLCFFPIAMAFRIRANTPLVPVEK